MSTPTLLGEAASRHDEAAWSRRAIELIQNDQRRSADTHLQKLYLPAFEGIDSISRTSRPIRPAA
jgi:cysteine synthase A